MPLEPLKFYLINAFAPKPHGGNQAAVVFFPTADDPRADNDAFYLATAADFYLAETAFLVPAADSTADKPHYGLRWFTPEVEVPLCGHATLASAVAVFKEHPTAVKAQFTTRYRGDLFASRESDPAADSVPGAPTGIGLDLTISPTTPVSDEEALLYRRATAESIDIKPEQILGLETYEFGDPALVVEVTEDVDLQGSTFKSAPWVNGMAAPPWVVVVTQLLSKGTEVGPRINSRVFQPTSHTDEDPVTGSAHTALLSYYLTAGGTERIAAQVQPGTDLTKVVLDAHQVSPRYGAMTAAIVDGRAKLTGQGWVWGRGSLESFDN